MDNLDQALFQIGTLSFSTFDFALILLGIMFLLAVLALFVMWRNGKRRAEREALMIERSRESELRMAELVATQNALSGRLAAMSENMTAQNNAMQNQMNSQLQGMSGHLNKSIVDTTKTTQENLAKLQERLAVIDSAQNNIQALTGEVVSLQAILENKQTRGAFGQSRMETIVSDGLPMHAFNFQATLSNGMRPDCLIHMPNEAPDLVIDAKFPLEAWSKLRESETPEQKKVAIAQFKKDMGEHIKAISQKYLIAGETHDTAFMFVPSESIFADIHEQFEDIVQRAHKARVVIVSPSLLMLSIQVVQAILKDVRMREQAHLIQSEVIHLMDDLSRLDERVAKLAQHFALAQKDIEMISTSSRKIARRGENINKMEFDNGAAANSSNELVTKPAQKPAKLEQGEPKLNLKSASTQQ
jgi:DNA recombination protein RmuC